jgi:hypothetical protein
MLLLVLVQILWNMLNELYIYLASINILFGAITMLAFIKYMMTVEKILDYWQMI